MAATDLTTLDAVKLAAGIPDASEDPWLSGTISAVSQAIESDAVTGRWLAPRGPSTLLFDAPSSRDELPVRVGVSALTYLGVAYTDQPDDGTGAYTEIASGYYLDPPAQDRWAGAPATAVTLGRLAGHWFPCSGERRAVKATGTWGWASTPARVAQIATAAVVRAYRAKESGGADYSIIGPDGGMRILRDLAPAELAELQAMYRVPVAA